MQRLKTRPQFQAVLEGKLVSKSSHFALHRLELGGVSAPNFSRLASKGSTVPDQACPFARCGLWIGAMAPKRWAKRAVTRNAVKRQIYTVCVKLDSVQQSAAFLVRLRREFSRKDFPSASSALLKEAVRIELLALLQDYLAPA